MGITKLPPAGSPILREAHNLGFPEHVGNGRFVVTAFRVQYLDRACPFPWLQRCGAPVGSGLQPEHSLSSYLLTLQCCSVPTFEAAPLLGTNNESQPHRGNLCWGEKTGQIKASVTQEFLSSSESLNNYGLEICQKAKPLSMQCLTMNRFLCS